MKKQVRSLRSAYSRLFQSIGAEVRVLTVREPTPRQRKIDSPESAIEYWVRHVARAAWYDPEREMVVVLCCDTKYNVIAFHLVSLGTLNETVAHPRDIFRPAIALNSHAVLLMHNHPSGDAKPGKIDEALTSRIRSAGELLQIKLLDHVIVGAKRSFSFNCGRVRMPAARKRTSARVREQPCRQLYLPMPIPRGAPQRPGRRELMKLHELLRLQIQQARERARHKSKAWNSTLLNDRT